MAEEQELAKEEDKRAEVARRRARVLEMFNRGLSQQEMAGVLGVDQSTVSRDIGALSAQAREEFELKVFKDHWLEMQRMTALHEGAMKRVWELVDEKGLTFKERISALSLLLKCHKSLEGMVPTRQEDMVI